MQRILLVFTAVLAFRALAGSEGVLWQAMFEPGEGYRAGPVTGQAGWYNHDREDKGGAAIVPGEGRQGSSALVSPADGIYLKRGFPSVSLTRVYFDCWIRFPLPAEATKGYLHLRIGGFHRRNPAELYWWGSRNSRLSIPGTEFSMKPGYTPGKWTRYTFELDWTRRRQRAWIDGEFVGSGPFRSPDSAPSFQELSIVSARAEDTGLGAVFDELRLTSFNPLLADSAGLGQEMGTVRNPGFEEGAQHWQALSGSGFSALRFGPGTAHKGDASVLLLGAQTVLRQVLLNPAREGEYTLTFWALAPALDEVSCVRAEMGVGPAGRAGLVTVSVTAPSTGAWQFVEATGRVTAAQASRHGAAWIEIRGLVPGGWARVDDVHLQHRKPGR